MEKWVSDLEDVRVFIEREYRDPRCEPDGEWLAKEAREPHGKLVDVICAVSDRLTAEQAKDAEIEALTHDLTRSMDTCNEYVNQCAALEAQVAELTALLREVRACRVYRSGETVHGTQYGGEAVPRAATGTDGEAVMTHTEVTREDWDTTCAILAVLSPNQSDWAGKIGPIIRDYRIASTTDLEKRVAVLEEALFKISRAVHSNRLVSHKLTKIDETCRAALQTIGAGQ